MENLSLGKQNIGILIDGPARPDTWAIDGILYVDAIRRDDNAASRTMA